MAALLLDTHAWAWSLQGSSRLSAPAIAALSGAEAVYVSPISFFEIGQKVRTGKWPEMDAFVTDLPDLLVRQGGLVASLTPSICLAGATMEWTHRDPFDRLLAATSLESGLPLLSADAVFDELCGRGGWRERIW